MQGAREDCGLSTAPLGVYRCARDANHGDPDPMGVRCVAWSSIARTRTVAPILVALDVGGSPRYACSMCASQDRFAYLQRGSIRSAEGEPEDQQDGYQMHGGVRATSRHRGGQTWRAGDRGLRGAMGSEVRRPRCEMAHGVPNRANKCT